MPCAACRASMRPSINDAVNAMDLQACTQALRAKVGAASGLDATLDALGAKRSGTDVYVSATKLFLAQGLLVNATLRGTKANQNGLLGHGARLGGADNGYEFMPEIAQPG